MSNGAGPKGLFRSGNSQYGPPEVGVGGGEGGAAVLVSAAGHSNCRVGPPQPGAFPGPVAALLEPGACRMVWPNGSAGRPDGAC